MFGIGPMELIVIAIVAMVFIGPEKLPDVMRKFGKIFVQVRRQANEVRSSFNEVIHDAERDFELEKIRDLQRKLQSNSPAQILNAAMTTPETTGTSPLPGTGFDAQGHPLPGHDEHGHPLSADGLDHSVGHNTNPVHDYHEGHYVDGQYVANSDTFLAWDPNMDKPLSELFPVPKPAVEPAPGSDTVAANPAPAAAPATPPVTSPDKTPEPKKS